MRLLFLSAFIFVFITFFKAQENARQSLILVHFDITGNKNLFKQAIYSYHFLNGSYTGRDEIITVQGKKEGKDYIRTDLGIPKIYYNRYLITGIGNIIDLKDKKILFDGRANLVKCNADSAVFYTNDIFKGKFYSVYKFGNNSYEEVKDLLFKPSIGQVIEFDKTTTPYKINYYVDNKTKTVIAPDAGYGQQGVKDNKNPDPPHWWLDNNTFVYGNFNQPNTELTFYKTTLQGKNDIIGKVLCKQENKAANVSQLGAGKTIVYLGSKQILIDSDKNSVTDMAYSFPENNFTYECKAGPNARAIKLKDKEVGKFPFQSKNFKTENNIAALVKEMSVGDESYQQGLMIWNAVKQSWDKLDTDEVLTMAGWVVD
jgi:hypothetical protein